MDGVFYMTSTDFVKAFSSYYVGYWYSNYINNIYDALNDDGVPKFYTFTLS